MSKKKQTRVMSVNQRTVNPTLPTTTLTPELRLRLSGGVLLAIDNNNHSVTIPFDLNGLRLLKLMLRAKELAPHSPIASPAEPTQAMVNTFLKNKKLEKEVKAMEDFDWLRREF